MFKLTQTNWDLVQFIYAGPWYLVHYCSMQFLASSSLFDRRWKLKGKTIKVKNNMGIWISILRFSIFFTFIKNLQMRGKVLGRILVWWQEWLLCRRYQVNAMYSNLLLLLTILYILVCEVHWVSGRYANLLGVTVRCDCCPNDTFF